MMRFNNLNAISLLAIFLFISFVGLTQTPTDNNLPTIVSDTFEENNVEEAALFASRLDSFRKANLTINDINEIEFYTFFSPFLLRLRTDFSRMESLFEHYRANGKFKADPRLCVHYIYGIPIPQKDSASVIQALKEHPYTDGLADVIRILLETNAHYYESIRPGGNVIIDYRKNQPAFTINNYTLTINAHYLTKQTITDMLKEIGRLKLLAILGASPGSINYGIGVRVATLDESPYKMNILRSGAQSISLEFLREGKAGWNKDKINATLTNPCKKIRAGTGNDSALQYVFFINNDNSYIVFNVNTNEVIAFGNSKDDYEKEIKKYTEWQSYTAQNCAQTGSGREESPCPKMRSLQAITGNILSSLEASEGIRNTKIPIHKDDYVFISTRSSARLWQSTLPRLIDPDGVKLPPIVKKIYPDFKYGQLLCKVGDQVYGFERFQINSDNPNPLGCDNVPDENYFKIKFEGDYIIMFISENDGELEFLINDLIHSDNSGNYGFDIYILSKQEHQFRNCFNACPSTQPTALANNDAHRDNKQNIWCEDCTIDHLDKLLEDCYHGGRLGNIDYRARRNSPAAEIPINGCQCVYDTKSQLVNSTNSMGTFDYGYWRNNEDIKLHYILDIAPHWLWRNKEGENYEQYMPTPKSRIY